VVTNFSQGVKVLQQAAVYSLSSLDGSIGHISNEWIDYCGIPRIKVKTARLRDQQDLTPKYRGPRDWPIVFTKYLRYSALLSDLPMPKVAKGARKRGFAPKTRTGCITCKSKDELAIANMKRGNIQEVPLTIMV
jgi:hypothetical protein